MMRFRPAAALASAALTVSAAALTIDTASAQALPLLPAEREAALARTAAAADISDHATVWVLGPEGYRLHAEGTNGWSCMVERDHPESLAPQCYDPEGTRSLVPGVLRLEELRAGGLGYRDAVAVVEEEYRTGALPEPTRPVLAYMLSREQALHATPEGPPVGHWKPHVMIYHPAFSSDALALPEGGLASVGSVGRIFTYLVFPVARWSDGSLADHP